MRRATHSAPERELVKRNEKSREKSHTRQVRDIHHQDITATTFEEISDMLKNVFFPPPPAANLSDGVDFSYPVQAECLAVITKEEVASAI